jgi:hypothetical protein
MVSTIGLYGTWLVLLITAYVSSMYILSRYQDATFIKVRGFWSIVLQLTSITLCGISICFKGAFDEQYPFRISLPFANFLVFFNVLIVFERSLMLIINFRISTECVQRAHDKFQTNEVQIAYSTKTDFERKTYAWLLQNRTIFHTGLFSKSKLACLVIAIIFNLPTLISFQILPQETAQTVGNVNGIVFCFCLAVATGISTYFLKPVEENFKIKKELVLLTFIAFGIFFMISLVSLVSKTPNPSFRSIYAAIGIAEILVSGGWIAVLSRKNVKKASLKRTSSVNQNSSRDSSRKSHGSKGSLQTQLAQMLEDKDMRLQFEQFLIREFAVEELLFWSAVRKFTESFSLSDSWTMAKEIYSEFVSMDARMCINISAPIRHELDNTFNTDESKDKLSPAIFAGAVKEVLVLLSQDSFPRFLRQQDSEAQNQSAPVDTVSLEVNYRI